MLDQQVSAYEIESFLKAFPVSAISVTLKLFLSPVDDVCIEIAFVYYSRTQRT